MASNIGARMKNRIRRQAWKNLETGPTDVFIEPDGIVNSTLLAEAVADDLEHPEWLDDDTHELWDIVAEVGWQYENPVGDDS